MLATWERLAGGFRRWWETNPATSKCTVIPARTETEEKIPQVLTTPRKVQALGRLDCHPFHADLKPAPAVLGLSPPKLARARDGRPVPGGTQAAPRAPQHLPAESSPPRKCQGQAALNRGGDCARPRLSRLRPRATARARRAGAVGLGGRSQGCQRTFLPVPTRSRPPLLEAQRQ